MARTHCPRPTYAHQLRRPNALGEPRYAPAMVERLLEKDISAVCFDASAVDGALPSQARTVVIGAGIVGSSVAYHLAHLGEEVLVVERASVASGTSWHAAGLVVRGRSTHVFTELASYGVDLYGRLPGETDVDVNLDQCGSLTLARTAGRLDELKYVAGVARHHDIPNELIDPARVEQLCPIAVGDGLVGALFQPDDGHVNPGMAALALATGAHRSGAVFREGIRVTGVRTLRGRITGVVTDRGVIECERAVLAGGLWARDLGEMCGVSVPLWPAKHIHVQTAPMDGVTAATPVLR